MNKNQTDCEQIQQLISAGEVDDQNIQISDHLKICADCQAYTRTVEHLKNNFALQNRKDVLVPRPEIRQKLLALIHDRTLQKSFFWTGIKKIMTYRIPAYQIAAAAMIIILVFFALENFQELDQKLHSSPASDILPNNPQLSQINILDSLNLSGLQNIGRNALEDSAITKYLVGSL